MNTKSAAQPDKANPRTLYHSSPFDRLPQELLLGVFSFLAREARPLLEEAGLKPLSYIEVPWIIVPSVCRWWRSTADLCPDLWTVINFWTPETTDKLLVKSGGRPLDLIFTSGSHSRFSSQPTTFTHALDGTRFFKRARYIKFELADMNDEEWDSQANWPNVEACAKVLTTILSTPAPQLVSLYLANTLDFEEMPNHNAPDATLCHALMLPSDYPILRHLYLDCWITIAPSDLFFRIPLSSLTLSRGVYFKKFGQFLDLMAGLPTLVELKIHNQDDDIFDCYLPSHGEDHMEGALLGHKRGSITLASLALFEYTLSNVDLIVEIMRWIQIPHTARVVLKRVPFLGNEVASSTLIQEDVDVIFALLETYISISKPPSDTSFPGLASLTATIHATTDEENKPMSTLRIYAYHIRLNGNDEDSMAVDTAPQLDVSFCYYTDNFPQSTILNALFQLPRLLGNEATRLHILPATPWLDMLNPSDGTVTIYHAVKNDSTLRMHSLAFAAQLDPEDESTDTESSSSNTFLPHVSALDVHEDELPLPFESNFEADVNRLGAFLKPRIVTGSLKEVIVRGSHAERAATVDALNERLGGVVKWDE